MAVLPGIRAVAERDPAIPATSAPRESAMAAAVGAAEGGLDNEMLLPSSATAGSYTRVTSSTLAPALTARLGETSPSDAPRSAKTRRDPTLQRPAGSAGTRPAREADPRVQQPPGCSLCRWQPGPHTTLAGA